MEIIPAVSIMDGRVVRIVNGSYVYLKNKQGKFRKFSNILKRLKENYEAVYVLDINGIKRNTPDLNLIQQTNSIMPIWFDAAPITAMGLMDILVAGASKAVVSTRKMQATSLLKEATDMSENIIFSIDFDGSVVSPSSTISGATIWDLSTEASGMGIKEAMFFDLGRAGPRTQLKCDLINTMIDIFDEIYVAGVISDNDFDELDRLGVSGAVVDFKTLQGWFRDE